MFYIWSNILYNTFIQWYMRVSNFKVAYGNIWRQKILSFSSNTPTIFTKCIFIFSRIVRHKIKDAACKYLFVSRLKYIWDMRCETWDMRQTSTYRQSYVLRLKHSSIQNLVIIITKVLIELYLYCIRCSFLKMSKVKNTYK